MNLVPYLLISAGLAELVLITQYYRETQRSRMSEMLKALDVNLKNSFVGAVHLLQHDALPKLPRHPKIHVYRTNLTRLTLSEALVHANKHLKGKLFAIVNNDISFEPGLSILGHMQVQRHLTRRFGGFFLSRYESNEQIGIGTQCGEKYMGSHDVFILHSPVPNGLISTLTEVFLGQPGADARFIYEARRVGLLIGNPCKTIRTIHHHHSQLRTPPLKEANINGKTDFALPETLQECLSRPPSI